MKKTLVALAVLAAGSAQAGIELYNQDKVTVNMTGDIEVVYKQAAADGAEFKQEIQDADFGFDVRYMINDDLQVGGYWEFDGASSDVTSGLGNAANVGDTYVAFYSNSVGSIKIGRLATVLDDAGVGSDYQFGISSFFNNGSPFSGDEAVRYDIDKGTFYGSVAVLQDKNNNAGLGEDGMYFDAKLGARVADFDFTAFAGQAKIKENAGQDDKESLYALEARYAGFENLGLGLGYYAVKSEVANVDSDTNSLAFAADYTLNAWKFAGGYARKTADNTDDQNHWYLNAGYALAPSTTAYVEVGDDGADKKTGVAVGIKAAF